LPDSSKSEVIVNQQTVQADRHALQHHFGDLDQQREASKLGMWLFLVTEVMFFGGMFCVYLVYRSTYPDAWAVGSQGMHFWIGTINTVVLICSSLSMAMAVHAAAVGHRKALVVLLIITMLLGSVFLVLKAVEYYEHWLHHHIPGPYFVAEGPNPRGQQLFYSLYFAMTGFHALHMVIGVVIVGFITYWAWRGVYTPEYHNPVENTGLYWHFVDIVWIYLYPLLYLVAHKHG
jgi:cytochrome c oxidase subunit 3